MLVPVLLPVDKDSLEDINPGLLGVSAAAAMTNLPAP